MKKVISLLLTCCMLFMMAGSFAESEDITGEWYGDYFGVELTYVLNADGTAVMSMPGMGELGTSSWVLDGEDFVMTEESSGLEAKGTYADGKLTLMIDDTEIVFTRDHIAGPDIADVDPAAAEDAFNGVWLAAHAQTMGLYVDASMAGMADVVMEFRDGTLHFVSGDADSVTFFFGTDPIELTYADGTFSYQMEVPNDAEPITMKMDANMLVDGQLMLTMDTGYGDLTVYFEKQGDLPAIEDAAGESALQSLSDFAKDAANTISTNLSKNEDAGTIVTAEIEDVAEDIGAAADALTAGITAGAVAGVTSAVENIVKETEQEVEADPEDTADHDHEGEEGTSTLRAALEAEAEESGLSYDRDGWILSQDMAMTDELFNTFDRAASHQQDMFITPILHLGTKYVENGTLECFLCALSFIETPDEEDLFLIYVSCPEGDDAHLYAAVELLLSLSQYEQATDE